MDTVNGQITTSASASITASTNLTSSIGISEITSAPIATTFSNTQSASSPQPNLSTNKIPSSFPLNLTIGIGIGIGISIILLIACCVPLYKLYKRRQQSTQVILQNQYNNQEPAQSYSFEMHYPMYYQQFQEMQIASNFHKEVDGDKLSRKSMDGCKVTPVFELSDRRQTDSWVKEMMAANLEELWMESPIR